MNFAYDKIVQGIGWNKNLRGSGKTTKKKDQGKEYIENRWNRFNDIPFYFERNNIETNIITIDDALKSNEKFVYYISWRSVSQSPSKYFGTLDNRFGILPIELVIAINNKQCKLVIWDHEAQPFTNMTSEFVCNKLQDAMILPDNVVYITSNYKPTDESRMKVVVWSWCESHIGYSAKDIIPKKDAKKFLCLNRNPAKHRTDFIRAMWDRDLLDQFNVSLGKVEGIDDFAKTTPYVYDSLSGNYEKDKLGFKDISFLHPWHQEENYLYVVTESAFDTVDTLDISEKTFKPIAMKMPFIIVGQPFVLKKLKELGYKTFPWDESYDETVDPNKRMTSIVDLVVYLNSRKDFVELIESCDEIVDHNFNLLKTRRPEMDMIMELS